MGDLQAGSKGRRAPRQRARRVGAILGVGVLLLLVSACQSDVIPSGECFNGSATVQGTTPKGVVHPGDTVVVTYHFSHEPVVGLTEFTGVNDADVTIPAGLTEGPSSSHPIALVQDAYLSASGSVTVHVDPHAAPGTLITWKTPNSYSFGIDHPNPYGPPTGAQTVTCTFASQRMLTLVVTARPFPPSGDPAAA